MTKAITLRHLGPEDFALLMAVPPDLFDNPLDPVQTRAFLDDPSYHCILAFDGEYAVGMATGQVMLHPDKPPAFFINEVGVRDSHQRQGIGKRLTQALMDHARSLGCQGIWLGTEADNTAAQALYRSLGGTALAGVFFGWDDAL